MTRHAIALAVLVTALAVPASASAGPGRIRGDVSYDEVNVTSRHVPCRQARRFVRRQGFICWWDHQEFWRNAYRRRARSLADTY